MGRLMSVDPLSSIEAILAEIEQIDIQTKGKFRQASDNEAYEIISQIEQKVRAKQRVEIE